MAVQNLLAALTVAQIGGILAGIWLVYAAVLAYQRLWLSPIAHVPGPRLAALTQYYEFYYDIILAGQYTFKIIALHKKYGPVVRVSPWEVHVAVHEFHSELYTGPTRPRARWPFWTKQFGAPDSVATTHSHDHHKLRRAALNTFFSTRSVRDLQPVVEERVDFLLGRLVTYANKYGHKPLNILYPFSAFTNDVINEYAFARSDHLVEKDEWGALVTDNMFAGMHVGHLIKHVGWLLTLVNSLPEAISGRCVPGWAGFLKMRNDIVGQIREIKETENTEKWQLDVDHRTIFHELLSSKLLGPQEKTVSRVAQEGQIFVQAGTLTTASCLSLAAFHLVNNPATMRKLRDELFAALPDPDEVVSVAKLENLPYLRAVVKEALRYNVGTSNRLPRIAPDETLVVRDPESGEETCLPPGTVVSMSPYMTLMNEDVFPDPTGFHPERWLKGEEHLERALLMTFGGGSRICLGLPLAFSELYLMLAKLFRRWGSGGIVGGSDEGDQRPGDVGFLKIYGTTVQDCVMAADYFLPVPYKGSKGLRFVLETC